MDENNDIVKKFEEILRNKRSVKPLSLYSGCKKYNSSSDKQARSSQLPTTHDLILNVSKQLKAIQNADYVTTNKSKEKINTVKTSKFLPLTVFEKEIKTQQPPQTKNTNRFETQCVSDTQLIDLIQDAEIMDVQSGVTQEFDHTFCYDDNSNPKNDDKYANGKNHYTYNDDDNNCDTDCNDIEMLRVNNPIKIDNNLELNENILELKVLNTDVIEINSNDNLKLSSIKNNTRNVMEDENNDKYSEDMFQIIDISLKEPQFKEVDDPNLITNSHIGEVFDQKDTSDFKNEEVDFGDTKMDVDERLPTSQIFNVKSLKKSSTTLVFDLDKFEAFEQVASQIIEMNDFETAKCLINSQILGKELLLPSIKDESSNIDLNYENVAPLSPIIETKDKTKKTKESKKKIVETGEKNVQFNVTDEILFSSDEEAELLRKNSEEIPFTCKINLSGLENDDWDDTMYVGFQTASNKSIQICTESFAKAKNLFEHDNQDIDTQELLIADLVEKFDGNSKYNDKKSKKSEAFIPIQISLENLEDNNTKMSVEEVNNAYFVNKTDHGKTRSQSSSSNNTVYSDDMVLTNMPANKVIKSNTKQKNQKDMEATHLFDTLENMKDKVTDIITQDLNDSIEEKESNTVADEDISKVFETTEMNLNLREKKYENSFAGFNTASNKNIAISESALVKYKKIFQDNNMKTDNAPKSVSGLNAVNIETKYRENVKKNRAKVTLGFKTASNKDINISTKALNDTKDFYKAIDEIDTINAKLSDKNRAFPNNNLSQITQTEMQKSKSFPGFKTANNKDIIVSKEALLISKELFQNCEDDVFLSDENKPFKGFKTASNKTIVVSETASAKSKQLFQDIKDDSYTAENAVNKFKSTHFVKNLNENNLMSSYDRNNTNKPKQPIQISTKALQQSKNNFQGINNENVNNIDDANENNTENTKDKNCVEDLLENSNIIEEFEMDVFENETNINAKELKNNGEYKAQIVDENFSCQQVLHEANKIIGAKQEHGKLQGFKTGNNKEIVISKEALERTKRIFDGIDCDNTDNEPIIKQEYPKLAGFKTASYKNIVTSEEPLARSNIFERIDNNEDNITNQETKFVGFKTASKKEVTISKEALAKSKKILEGIDNNHEESSSKQESAKFVGFKTASKKEVTISKEALARSKKIFEGIDNIHEDSQSKQETSNFFGFKTASKKEVTISKEALARSKKIFEGIDNIHEDSQSKQETSNFFGFKTASKKDVTISKEGLARSKKIFEGIDNIHEDSQSKQETSNFFGFKTASKKEVTISKEALARSKKIFEGINNIHEDSQSKQETSNFLGFKTASKKEVTISKEALARSKKIFEGVNNIYEDSSSEQKTAKFVGFKTASKKEVTISNEALTRSKKIFEGLDNINDHSQMNHETVKFVGFQTASNKEVAVSKEALATSKKIFEGLDCLNEEYTKQEPAKFIGFPTAINKKVNTNEAALKQSKNLLEIEDYNKLTGNPKFSNDTRFTDDTKFSGFKTASNKTVAVSEQDLAKTRNIFDGLDIFENIPLTKGTTEFAGFQTASNKKVIVSEDALRKSKLLFDNVTQNYHDANFDNKIINLNKDVELDEEILQSQVLTIKNVNNKESTSKITTNSPSKSDNVEANMDSFMDTQVLNNFEQTLYTEDFFKDASRKSKRSGSPILSCPKPKRRKKFEIPYSQKKIKSTTDIVDNTENSTSKSQISIFDSNLPKIEFDSNYKKNKKYTLNDLDNIEIGQANTAIDPYITKFKFEDLPNFEFENDRNNITATKLKPKDLKLIFEKSVNKKLVPQNWIENHMQLIIWKLISYEIRFQKLMANTCTARNVLNQLKYRYDRELFNMERPPLRKIYEKDDIPSKCMVLCVVLVYENDVSVSSISSPTSSAEILLTDGWYTIKTTIDKMLTKLIYDGKIKIGSKLMVQGAELLNCDQGIAPWEDNSQIRLKISGNSTAPVPWSTRLGWSPCTLLSRVRHVSSCGGRVSRLRVFVSTVYPPLTVEKLNCNTVTRSERLEHLHQMKHEADRQVLMETIYEEVEKEMEFQDQDSQESDCSEPSSKRRCLETGSQIARVMKGAKDLGEFQSHLTSTQRDLLQEHTMRKRDKLIQKVQERVKQKIEEAGLNVNRNVVSLVKARVVDVEEKGGKTEVHRALLSIWKANDSVMEIVKEGCWVEIMNVVPTAVRYSELQISAGRQSIFKKSKFTESEKVKAVTSTLKRTCYQLKDLIKSPTMATDNNEIDTVGFIFLVEPENRNFDSTKSHFQNVFVTDSEKNMICVNFWGGLKKYGYDNFLDTGQIVACVNLQKRVGNSRKNIPQYRATEFTYFTKTPKSDVARKIIEDLSLKFSAIDRRKFCEDCVNLKNNYAIVNFQGTEISPYRFQEVNMSKNKMFIDSPLARKSSEDFNLTGLDFESTFKQTDTQELSPKTLLKKKKVNEKIAKLKFYGEYYGEPPPALSPIQMINISKNAGNSFKSPLLLKSEANVASKEKIVLKEQNSVENLEENNQLSPVLNRTYVKKNINPVKLNFSNATENNIENSIDHFAEDFDGSPPLSLE